jgi:hypothetical protein
MVRARLEHSQRAIKGTTGWLPFQSETGRVLVFCLSPYCFQEREKIEEKFLSRTRTPGHASN